MPWPGKFRFSHHLWFGPFGSRAIAVESSVPSNSPEEFFSLTPLGERTQPFAKLNTIKMTIFYQDDHLIISDTGVVVGSRKFPAQDITSYRAIVTAIRAPSNRKYIYKVETLFLILKFTLIRNINHIIFGRRTEQGGRIYLRERCIDPGVTDWTGYVPVHIWTAMNFRKDFRTPVSEREKPDLSAADIDTQLRFSVPMSERENPDFNMAECLKEAQERKAKEFDDITKALKLMLASKTN